MLRNDVRAEMVCALSGRFSSSSHTIFRNTMNRAECCPEPGCLRVTMNVNYVDSCVLWQSYGHFVADLSLHFLVCVRCCFNNRFSCKSARNKNKWQCRKSVWLHASNHVSIGNIKKDQQIPILVKASFIYSFIPEKIWVADGRNRKAIYHIWNSSRLMKYCKVELGKRFVSNNRIKCFIERMKLHWNIRNKLVRCETVCKYAIVVFFSTRALKLNSFSAVFFVHFFTYKRQVERGLNSCPKWWQCRQKNRMHINYLRCSFNILDAIICSSVIA